MSHSVTIQTRTVTTGSPSVVNTGFCRSWPGLLKIVQVALGAACVGLSSYAISHYFGGQTVTENLFFLLMATTFMVATALLVLSCLCSYTTESIISKTTFELLYHAFGFALILAASVTLLTKVSRGRYRSDAERLEMGAATLGLLVMCFELDSITYQSGSDTFLLLMATAFMMGTAIFIFSYIFSPVSEAIISKTNYEIIYNIFAVLFLLIASIIVLAEESRSVVGGKLAAAVLALINGVLYAISTLVAVKKKV